MIPPCWGADRLRSMIGLLYVVDHIGAAVPAWPADPQVPVPDLKLPATARPANTDPAWPSWTGHFYTSCWCHCRIFLLVVVVQKLLAWNFLYFRKSVILVWIQTFDKNAENSSAPGDVWCNYKAGMVRAGQLQLQGSRVQWQSDQTFPPWPVPYWVSLSVTLIEI